MRSSYSKKVPHASTNPGIQSVACLTSAFEAISIETMDRDKFLTYRAGHPVCFGEGAWGGGKKRSVFFFFGRRSVGGVRAGGRVRVMCCCFMVGESAWMSMIWLLRTRIVGGGDGGVLEGGGVHLSDCRIASCCLGWRAGSL